MKPLPLLRALPRACLARAPPEGATDSRPSPRLLRSPPEADAGGNTDVTLTAPMKARIIAFSKSTIDELAGCAVSSKAFAFSVTGVEKAAHYVAGLDEEGLEVTLKTSAGDVTVSLLEECHTGDMVRAACARVRRSTAPRWWRFCDGRCLLASSLY